MYLSIKVKIFLGISILILCSVILFRVMNTGIDSTYESASQARHFTEHGSVMHEIEYLTAEGHLWFEERMSGDTTNDVNECYNRWEKSSKYCEILARGGEISNRTIIAIENQQVKSKLLIASDALKELVRLGKLRFAALSTKVKAIGDDSDQKFDAKYEQAIDALDEAEAMQQKAITEITTAAAEKYNESHSQAVITLSVISVIGVLLMIQLYFSVLRPISQLAKTTDIVSAGNYDAEISYRSKDELGKLAEGFRTMLAGISASQLKINMSERYLKENVHRILVEMELFAAGDLTVELVHDKDDDIGRLCKGFTLAVEKICDTMVRVAETVETTASASAQIAANSMQISTGASIQAEQAGNVAAAVEEMTSNIIESNRAMTRALRQANTAKESAESGGKVVVQTIEGMNKIADVVQKSAGTVRELGKSSEEIGEIVQVINDIADQTNLLALNAAIEAARAGEQGRGFAVVADEVRKLAERTGEATKKISMMIKRIQHETTEAVTAMSIGTSEVEKGKVLADKAGVSLGEIITLSDDVQFTISQLSNAIAEQETTSADIARSIQHISSVASESNRAISQVASSTDDMSHLATVLQSLLRKFNTDTGNEMNRQAKVHRKQLSAQYLADKLQ